jgi:hypothetical protein
MDYGNTCALICRSVQVVLLFLCYDVYVCIGKYNLSIMMHFDGRLSFSDCSSQ